MTEFWDRRAKQFLVFAGIILLLFVCLKFAKYFADILIVVGISILIAYLLIGPVDFLTKILKFRAIAVMVTYLGLISFFSAILIFVAPKVIKEFAEFTKQIPEIILRVENNTNNLQVYLNRNNISINLPSITSIKSGLLSKFGNLTLDPLGNILGVALGTFHILFYILVTAVTNI